MYNKLFTKILDSSIWLEDKPTRIVWITMLAAMDEDGFVALASPLNVARRANLKLAETERAINVLESPDTVSPGQDHEGRRIERVPGGWHVINAAKYREMLNRVALREQTRLRVARHRAKKEQNPKEGRNADAYSSSYTGVTFGNANVTPDGEAQFEILCAGYSKPEYGQAAQVAFMDSVQDEVQRLKIDVLQAVNYIIERAKKYSELVEPRYQKGLTAFLRDRIYRQDEAAWGKKTGKVDLDEFYKTD